MTDTASNEQHLAHFFWAHALTCFITATILLFCGTSPARCATDNDGKQAKTTSGERWTWSEEKQRVVAITEPDEAPKDNPPVESRIPDSIDQKPNSTKRMQIRQGSELVGVLGYFRDAGDRIIFYSADSSVRLVVLENLSLERVGKILEFAPEELMWQVSGVVTEYESQNYLLLRQAVLQSSNLRIPLEGSN